MKKTGLRWLARVFAIATLNAALVLTPAHAQTYLEEFDAYNQALKFGDQESAAEHGYAAWQAAEAELGDHKLTAILAYNYGQLVLYTETEKALVALKRADALAQAGLAELPSPELKLYIAYAEFTLAEGKRREANALRDALLRWDKEGIPPNSVTVRMWLELATSDLENKRYEHGKQSAGRAQTHITIVLPDNYRLRASAMVLQGASYVMLKPRREANLITAIEILRNASALFPSQKSIEDFDDVFAKVLAWRVATAALFSSEGFDERDIPESEVAEKPSIEGSPLNADVVCNDVWENRPIPKYPSDALNRGYVGAVLIGYHLDDGLTPNGVRILSEVPAGRFSDSVLSAMAEWRLKDPTPVQDHCRKNRLTNVSFVIK